GNPYVIAGAKPGAPLVNLEKPWRAVRDRVTLGMWRDSEDEKIATLFAELSRKLKDRALTVAEFRKAAADRAISLPAGLSDVRIHDLRHAFASVAASSRMGLPIIGKMRRRKEGICAERLVREEGRPNLKWRAAHCGSYDNDRTQGRHYRLCRSIA